MWFIETWILICAGYLIWLYSWRDGWKKTNMLTATILAWILWIITSYLFYK